MFHQIRAHYQARISRIFFNTIAWCPDPWRSCIRRDLSKGETGRTVGTHLKRSQSVTECRKQLAIWRIFVNLHPHKLRASWKFTPLTFGVHRCPSDWTIVQLQRQKSSQTRSINTLRKSLISLQDKDVQPRSTRHFRVERVWQRLAQLVNGTISQQKERNDWD